MRDYTRKKLLRAAVAHPFSWITSKDGEGILPRRMESTHLFNALNMVFTHHVPETLRDPNVTWRPDVAEWPEQYAVNAATELCLEYGHRNYTTEKVYERWKLISNNLGLVGMG